MPISFTEAANLHTQNILKEINNEKKYLESAFEKLCNTIDNEMVYNYDKDYYYLEYQRFFGWYANDFGYYESRMYKLLASKEYFNRLYNLYNDKDIVISIEFCNKIPLIIRNILPLNFHNFDYCKLRISRKLSSITH